MADDVDKGRPVHVTSPGYRSDKTNDLRIRKDDAQRLIARYLREKLNPGDANDLANRIVDGIVASQKTASRPSLRDWRMIPSHPPEDVISRLASSIGQFAPPTMNGRFARRRGRPSIGTVPHCRTTWWHNAATRRELKL